ncbi:MAG: radical SAM protein [Hyphomicrobiales bacterium]
MGGILFNEIIFGPIKSRRLGVSLGINLLPTHSKHCSFNCIYCECGWNPKEKTNLQLPTREEVREAMEYSFKKIVAKDSQELVPDAITFAGNGEPTIHPEFCGIIDDTIALRDKYLPNAKVAVLSNATMIHKEEIFEALNKVDDNILKIDGGTSETIKKINLPKSSFDLKQLVGSLKKFNGDLIIQTLFLRGMYNGIEVDNTTSEEVDAWLNIIRELQPKSVMIYPIDRATPAKDLIKVPKEELEKIAFKVKGLNIPVQVY